MCSDSESSDSASRDLLFPKCSTAKTSLENESPLVGDSVLQCFPHVTCIMTHELFSGPGTCMGSSKRRTWLFVHLYSRPHDMEMEAVERSLGYIQLGCFETTHHGATSCDDGDSHWMCFVRVAHSAAETPSYCFAGPIGYRAEAGNLSVYRTRRRTEAGNLSGHRTDAVTQTAS